MAITREQLLKPDKLKVEEVPEISVGKDKVFVTQMNAHRQSVYAAMLNKQEPELDAEGNPTGKTVIVTDTVDWQSKLAACAMCNEKGELLLDPKDWKVLSQSKAGVFIDAVAAAASRLNKMTTEDQEMRIKNSGAAQRGSSNSSSPSTAPGPTQI